MERVDLAQLLAQLAAARTRRGPRIAIACDGDGTVWRGDVGEALFAAALEDDAIKEAARPALEREAAAIAVPTSGLSAGSIAAQLYQAHADGRYGEEPLFAMMAWVFAGWSEGALSKYCRQVLSDCGFRDRLRPEMQAVLAWAQQERLPVWLVSASARSIVEAAAEQLEIPAARVLAMEPPLRDGVWQPGLANEATYAAGKSRRLRACCDVPLLAAFGDSLFDAELLADAHLAIAVHADPALLPRVRSIAASRRLAGAHPALAEDEPRLLALGPDKTG